MSEVARSRQNSAKTVDSNNDENSDEDGAHRPKRARKKSSSIKNNAENSNNSSHSHNKASDNSSSHTYGLRGKQNDESDVTIEENRGGLRFGSGRKSAASNKMDA